MIYVEKGNEGYKIDDADLGEYKARGFKVPGEKSVGEGAPSASEGASDSQDPSADDKKKSGQK